MIDYNTLVVLTGAGLMGAGCGLVGGFAVLRRRSLTGDALAHAALPGLCLAFLVIGERSLPGMLFGAFLSGIFGVLIISLLTHATRVKEDSAIGIVLSVFFGAGIVLSRLIQNRSTTGSKAGIDSYILGKTAGMIAQDVYLIGAVAGVSLLIVVVLYKELKLTAFDPGFARSQGWPALRLDVLLMVLIASNVVIGLPAVGVVLVAALLIIPAAAARFWTERLGKMLFLSAALGATIGLVGAFLSARFHRLPAGPVIVLTGTAVFLVSVLFAPKRGALGRILAHRRFRRELTERVVLRILFDLIEPGLPRRREVSIVELQSKKSWSGRDLRRALLRLRRAGLVAFFADDRIGLTDRGLQEAAAIVRNHRMWELFLTEHAELANGLVNLAETSVEDVAPRELVDELVASLRASGRMPLLDRQELREVLT